MKSRRFVIKKVSVSNKVLAFYKTLFPSDEFYCHEKNHYWILIDTKLNKWIGFASAALWTDGICFLSRCAIDSNYRGRGFQKALIEVREEFAKDNKCERLYSYTIPSNGASIKSLLSMDYKIIDWEDSPFGSDVVNFQKYIKYD